MKFKFLLVSLILCVFNITLMSQTVYVTNNTGCDLLVQGIAGTTCSYSCQTNVTFVADGAVDQPLNANCTWTTHKWIAVKYYKVSYPPTSGGVGARLSNCGPSDQSYDCGTGNLIIDIWTSVDKVTLDY